VSYTAQQRTREFGIRIALGARRGKVMVLVFHQVLILTLAGSLIGVCAAVLLTRVLTKLLFNVSPLDATSFLTSVVLLGLISVAACLIPALRAAHLDPVRALRSE